MYLTGSETPRLCRWWLGPESGYAANITAWRRPFRSTHAAPHDAFLMTNPIVHADTHLWLGSTGTAYTLPLFRLAGLWSEGNAEVAIPLASVPVRALTLNADVSWKGKLVTGGCDEGCNAYVFAEVQDPVSRAALPGFSRAEALPLMNVDGLRLPLQWGHNVGGSGHGMEEPSQQHARRVPVRSTAELAGRSVVVRIWFRSATLYALMIN
jgi:hypothetical protein